MSFIFMVITVALACSIITTKTLVGYTSLPFLAKLVVFFAITSAWMMPISVGILRRCGILSPELYNMSSYIGYALFGFAFILFMVLFARDVFWYIGYYAKFLPNPKDLSLLQYTNIAALGVAVFVSAYALWSGAKSPRLEIIELFSPKVTKELKILQINDMHIDRSKKVAFYQDIVEKINGLSPDIVVIPGDIADDEMDVIKNHLDVLSGIKSKYGVFWSAGNHEFYNGLAAINDELSKRGFKYLSNNGQNIEGIFLGGIPDVPTLRKEPINYTVLDSLDNKNYNILLNHNPKHAKFYINKGFDLMLSGHTHGGQIFPFHIPVKMANNYLSGLYEIGEGKLYISKGAGYWGPAMRLFAPADISLIALKPTNKSSAAGKYIE